MEVNLPGCFASIWDNSEGLSVTENNIPFKKSPSILLGLGRDGEAETGVRVIHDDLDLVRPTSSPLGRISSNLSNDGNNIFKIRHGEGEKA